MELNKIYNEDNILTLSRMENSSVNYCFTSPPYNINKSKYKEYKDNLKNYFDTQKNIINEMLRVTKNHVFYNIQMVSNNKIDLHNLIGHFSHKIKEVLIWNKVHGAPTMPGLFNSAYEYIIIFSNQSPDKRIFTDAKWYQGTQNNVFEIKNSHSNKFSERHNAIMPLDIPRMFMRSFGNDEDIWYDPYMGTGTTAISAIMENKQYIGSEISREYYDISEKRIMQHNSQLNIFNTCK